ncbi:Electron transfer flavoprotein, alpha subunit (modular protein) [uncultured delta proteobacterium]|uniref:Electron transfer flavoprotein, alpha subunit (Modular protein) n=1 Tax=uncultured delta proteobacterium TaxID=34034 RepID=A0A212K4H0_9DELT|nr:Electron transfer flavoprotein, alpha subunit (modular protein) [uncultured delta proteobacterium]
MKKHIAVWLDRAEGPFAVRDGHRAALAFAAASGGLVTAVMAAAPDDVFAPSLAEELARYGAKRIARLRLAPENSRNPEALAAAFAWALDQEFFTATPVTDMVTTANAAGRDFMARVASRRNAPLLQDCVAVDFDAGTGEKYLLQGRTCGVYSLPGPVRCWTLRPHAFACVAADKLPPAAPAVIADMAPPAAKTGVRPSAAAQKELGQTETDPLARMWAAQPDIMETPVIISGGRALESAENFRLLHETAAPLHAAVGASRSAVDMGYAPPFVQVGQTGVVVSPELYIACGISGSIFHTTGIKGARTVVAVNKDSGAQIFSRADYGITDDLFTVLPLLRRLLESGA